MDSTLAILKPTVKKDQTASIFVREVKKNIIPTRKKVDKFYFMRLLKLKFKTFTFASKNSVTNCYWTNPNIGMPNKTWDLVLNDNIHYKWYYFQIPANSIKLNQLVLSDKKYLIDLQIRYNDSSFTDTRSGISFVKWLKKTRSILKNYLFKRICMPARK